MFSKYKKLYTNEDKFNLALKAFHKLKVIYEDAGVEKIKMVKAKRGFFTKQWIIFYRVVKG